MDTKCLHFRGHSDIRYVICGAKDMSKKRQLLRIIAYIPTCIALQALVLGSFVFTNILVFSRMSCIFCVKDILYFLYAIFKVRYLSSYPCSGLPFKVIRQPPALPCRLQHSTIGRLGLNHRVRDGNGCVPQAHRHQKFFRLSLFNSSSFLKLLNASLHN